MDKIHFRLNQFIRKQKSQCKDTENVKGNYQHQFYTQKYTIIFGATVSLTFQ